MKNTLLLTALLAAFSFCKAQIFLETTIQNVDIVEFKGLIKLQHAGYKYYDGVEAVSFTLYNLDGTVYKHVNLPSQVNTASNVTVWYVSEDLFDLDSTDIEYMVSYHTPTQAMVEIYDENGNTIFSEDSVGLWQSSNGFAPIQNTDQGAKMMLAGGTVSTPFNSDMLVYSLPGLLPCDVCDGQRAIGTGLPPDGYNTQFKLYPNPADKYTIIEYDLPKDADNASLVVYNTAGQEQRRFKVDKGSRQMVLPTSEFTAGTYYYSLEVPGLGTTGKKALVIH